MKSILVDFNNRWKRKHNAFVGQMLNLGLCYKRERARPEKMTNSYLIVAFADFDSSMSAFLVLFS